MLKVLAIVSLALVVLFLAVAGFLARQTSKFLRSYDGTVGRMRNLAIPSRILGEEYIPQNNLNKE